LDGKTVIGFIVGVLVLLTMTLYLTAAGPLDFGEIALSILVLFMVVASLKLVIDRAREIKKGHAGEDEMSKRAGHKAGYFAYIASVWVAVALLWYNTFFVDEFAMPALDFGVVIGIIVLVPGIIFLMATFHFLRKGDVE